MSNKDVPFNVDLIDLNKERLSTLKPVLSLDIYDGASSNFHEDGLYSVSIFGRMGDESRDHRFSYIDVKVPVLHPIVYDRLRRIKALYIGILNGREYATFDKTLKDFVRSDPINGQTGYGFFMSHFKDLKFKESLSGQRANRIRVINKYRERALYDKVLIVPAGLREIEIDENGRDQENDVAELYRRVISISNTVGLTHGDPNSAVYNASRWSLQQAFNAIYTHFERLLSGGKKSFLQAKYASRNIFNGTRNVISAMDASVAVLGAPNAPSANSTVLGLYQFAKSVLPVTLNKLSTGWVSQVFGSAEGKAKLVNKDTLKAEYVDISVETRDRWATNEGLKKVLDSLSEPSLRHKPISIEKHYLGLIYVGPDNTFKIFGDIDELPPEYSRDNVHPLTLCQLVYLAGFDVWNEYFTLVTRYPVAGLGSIYVSKPYVKTTIRGEMRRELGPDWKPTGKVALEFPKLGETSYVDSMMPHATKLTGLTADFDGDTCSGNSTYSDESRAECRKHLNQAKTYIDPRGGLRTHYNDDGWFTVKLVTVNMTGD